MARAKKNLSCASRLRVIGTDIRLDALRMLGSGPKFVHELLAQLDVEQSLLSHHLQVLRRAGFVVSHREGKAVRYRLARTCDSKRSVDLGCCTLTFD